MPDESVSTMNRGMYVVPDKPRKQAAIRASASAAALEELHCVLVFCGSRPGVERAEVPALARFGVLLARVESVFTRGEFPDHVFLTRIACPRCRVLVEPGGVTRPSDHLQPPELAGSGHRSGRRSRRVFRARRRSGCRWCRGSQSDAAVCQPHRPHDAYKLCGRRPVVGDSKRRCRAQRQGGNTPWACTTNATTHRVIMVFCPSRLSRSIAAINPSETRRIRISPRRAGRSCRGSTASLCAAVPACSRFRRRRFPSRGHPRRVARIQPALRGRRPSGIRSPC
jgi:hypothetical protein